MIYQTKFTNQIKVDTQKEAEYVLMHFCEYCKKDAIGQLHCPWSNASICEEEKAKIVKDFSMR